MTREALLRNIHILRQMHVEGQLGGEVMPEDVLVGVVAEEELPDVLTLGMALNYQRNSYTLWESIKHAYLDTNSRWVFNPSAVSKSTLEELKEVLLKYRVALQPNRHPEIWQRVAVGIAQSSSSGSVMGFLSSEAVQYDIAALKEIMQFTRKTEFPYLSGPKIFNYWLYVMESYSGVKWKSRELITIAPDTHILKASVKLGLCSPEVLEGTADDRQIVAEAWETALKGTGLAPIDIHTPLWLWSRAGFPALEVPTK
ncbi:hypothetical protein E0485_04810 [Paenibacillus albiflavus]|uniref:Uncharacterized protein n=1 Tax=Paenibacillus albiflavus TaxID=2545760 RepID=A0A4R4EKY6_9BACL|nr:hypothetical protein [Paenibacillus albiflavus]TCZ80173.1 hypothetical protein E0485_04810 [Paenibacillus albiflavus]